MPMTLNQLAAVLHACFSIGGLQAWNLTDTIEKFRGLSHWHQDLWLGNAKAIMPTNNTLSDVELAAVMRLWSIHGDKDISLQQCVDGFKNLSNHSKDRWLAKASSMLSACQLISA